MFFSQFVSKQVDQRGTEMKANYLNYSNKT